MSKLYVLTGFLGAGKTTLLLKLIEALKGKKIGVIQNEFGKLSIDGDILRNDDIQMIEINKGSIFCSCLKLNFVQALTEMAEQDFDYLLVESSGLGDPSNVEEILNVVAHTAKKEFDFSGVICLVDGINFLNQLEDMETVNRQLKHCNMAVITKTDLVEEERITQIEGKIQEINPVCKIQRSQMGDLDISFLQEDIMQYQWAECEETTNSEETKPKTLFMVCKEPVEKELFETFIHIIKKDAYRIKGFVEFANEGFRQVDVVGERLDYKVCEAKEKAQLVIISRIGAGIIKPIFDTWKRDVGTEMELKN